jgi:hypothetical protein
LNTDGEPNSAQHLDAPWTPLTQMFTEMTLEDPLSRPTMAQALKCIRQFRSTMSSESFASRVPRPPLLPRSPSDDTSLLESATEAPGIDTESTTDVPGIDTECRPETDTESASV